MLGESEADALVASAKHDADHSGAELLARWRAQMLRGVLVTSTLALIPAVLIQLWQAVMGTAGVRNGMYLAIGAVIALAALSYAPISYATRAATLVAIGYVFTTAAIILEGFAPAQFVSVCMLIVLSVLFYSLRVAFLMLIAIAVAMVFAASIYKNGLIAPLAAAHLDVRDPLNWLRVGMYALFPSAVAAIATNYLIEQLQETVRAREAALIELRTAQARLLHAQKLQAIGQLAAGIAHDFNNTLSVIALEAELLKHRGASAGGAETTRAAESLLAAAERGTQLSRQLLLFGRAETSERGVIDAVPCVRDCVRTLQRLLPTEIVFDVALSGEPLPVQMHSGELQQIVLNLGINARDAMTRGGTLRIELSEHRLDAREAGSLHIAPGRYARLVCRDSGSGMDEATLARAFEPFFTTKGIGRGTGLGLTNVWNIAQRAGGAVDVKSERGQGTTLWVYVPRSDGPIVEHVPSSGSVRPPALAQETVLVVEDDIRIRALLVTTFAGAGYRVLDACDADAALLVEREHPGTIHLLCTDVVMPGSPVRELIEHFRKQRPATGILVCSGYSEDEQIARGVQRGELTHLEKPFTGKALLQKARAALDRSAAR